MPIMMRLGALLVLLGALVLQPAQVRAAGCDCELGPILPPFFALICSGEAGCISCQDCAGTLPGCLYVDCQIWENGTACVFQGPCS